MTINNQDLFLVRLGQIEKLGNPRATSRLFRTIGAAAVLVLSLFVLGCNTVEGVGEDVESAGNATQRAANRNR